MVTSFYQIILAVFACIIITERIIRFLHREKGQSLFKFLSVLLIWGGIAAVSLFPTVAYRINALFGFGENFNTIIFIAFVILFALFFRLLSIVERIESDITEIIRKEALKDLKK